MSDAEERSVPRLYASHPSPGYADKLEAADRRMGLRLHCCGVDADDYVGREVLDAGCGTGEYALWFASEGARVTGIDLSGRSLEEARSYAEKSGLENVTFEERSVLDTGFEADRFDLVYCTGVLHHTPAPFGGFRELCRVLRPGGKLLVSLYNLAGFLPRMIRWRIVRLVADEDPRDRVRWGRRLFPRTAARLHDDRLNDTESPLFDYFGVSRQSVHSLGEVLGWLDRCGLEYRGSFPPARLSDYPAMFAHPAYSTVEAKFRGPVQRWLARLGRGSELDRERPAFPSRLAAQFLWLVAGVGVFCVGGCKAPAEPA
ncbi:MAG: class I SAM-dependent methyltransferase [Gemmatimonadota bacterium]